MAAHEGELREFGPKAAGDPLTTPPSILRLAQVAVPWQVGPYFRTSADDPTLLGQYAESTGHDVALEEHRQLARLGTDQGYEICVDPQGTVQAVLLDYNEPTRFVNSSPERFAQSLLELDQMLRVVLGADQPQAAADAFAKADSRLRTLDPSAFTDAENWWPLVLDDIRDTSAADWYAAFEYIGADGQKQIMTRAGSIGLHPEERLWSALQGAGVEPSQVLKIHTELEACFMPGHYCSLWMEQTFPDAELTHNFPYGETAESRAQGIGLLREATAQAPEH
ncbi:SUKH-4 family immunity protein [Streptomyces decoyicus]|uniref:SUKH-4 family immunity protein n=1 Tax=Streptomyces decoyicus TaxID=249567 RepID=A0ABZ1FLZ3_9ACTN|nr:nucleic acid/nucleotide deaminase domain-containing protein [Streptomyces decoyicus]WSB71445.1 SUKH-4 family immunity protein [Streptomyces decoyicus]